MYIVYLLLVHFQISIIRFLEHREKERERERERERETDGNRQRDRQTNSQSEKELESGSWNDFPRFPIKS